jgi:hypothetical protein
MLYRIWSLLVFIVAVNWTTAGSASEYYALDEHFWSTATILEVCVERGRTGYSTRTVCLVFDEQGGSYVAGTGQVVGTDVDGDEISIDLDEVTQVKVTVEAKVGFEPVKLLLDALKRGDRWRSSGAIKRAILSTGETLLFKGMSPSLDLERRIMSWSCEGAAPVEIPFEDLLCVEMESRRRAPNANEGLISTVELLSGEKIDLTGLMPTLDLGRRLISYGVRQEPTAEIRLSDVQHILIDKCRALDVQAAIGQTGETSLSPRGKNEICDAIKTGARIRLQLSSGFDREALEYPGDTDVLTGTLGSCRDGVLVLGSEEIGETVVRVPLEYVQSLDLNRGKSSHTWEGAAAGLIAGLTVAMATQGSANGPEDINEGLQRLARGIGITVAGCVVGAAIGSAIGGREKWERVFDEESDGHLRGSLPGKYQVAAGFSF